MAEDLNLIVNGEEPIEFEINERSPIDLKITDIYGVHTIDIQDGSHGNLGEF